MLIETSAIILSKIKYSDSSFIIKAYTESSGLKSFIFKGVRNKKGNVQAFFQSLTIVELQITQKENSNLGNAKSVTIKRPTNVYASISKSSIAIFIAEIVARYFKEEAVNKEFYSFLEEEIITLDKLDKIEKINQFSLMFLINTIKFLGISPNKPTQENTFFCLQEGLFLPSISCVLPLSDKKNALLIQLLNGKLQFNLEERRILLQTLTDYIDNQLSCSGKIKSLEVLSELA